MSVGIKNALPRHPKSQAAVAVALALATALSCSLSNGKCGPGNCDGCCDRTGTCIAGDNAVNCGANGARCQSCTQGFCQGGTCFGGTGMDSGSGSCQTTCPGCCDSNNTCQTGNAASACGVDGGVCQQCVLGTSCTLGVCKAGAGCGGCVEPNGSCSCSGTPCIPLLNARNTYCGAPGTACTACGTNQFCGYTSEMCGAASTTATVGSPCAGDSDCPIERGAGSAPDCLQSGWPGGYCTEPCSNDFNNPNFGQCSQAGAICAGSVAGQGGGTSVCLQPCTNTSQCRGPAYICDPVLGACSPACTTSTQCASLWNTGAVCNPSYGTCCGLTGMPCCSADGGCSGPDNTGAGTSTCQAAKRTCS